jgi:hypothetical protein
MKPALKPGPSTVVVSKASVENTKRSEKHNQLLTDILSGTLDISYYSPLQLLQEPDHRYPTDDTHILQFRNMRWEIDCKKRKVLSQEIKELEEKVATLRSEGNASSSNARSETNKHKHIFLPYNNGRRMATSIHIDIPTYNMGFHEGFTPVKDKDGNIIRCNVKSRDDTYTPNYGRVDNINEFIPLNTNCKDHNKIHAPRFCHCPRIPLNVSYADSSVRVLYGQYQQSKPENDRRWIIHGEYVSTGSVYSVVLYDNHGQPHYGWWTFNPHDKSSTFTSRVVEGVVPLKTFLSENTGHGMYIQEDDELFPTPLSDYWIDLIKSGAIDCRYVRILQEIFTDRKESVITKQESAVQQVEKLTQATQTITTSNDDSTEDMMDSRGPKYAMYPPVHVARASLTRATKILSEGVATDQQEAIEQTRSEGFNLLTEANKMERDMRKEPLLTLRAQFQTDNPGASDDAWTAYLEQHIASLKGSEAARRKAAEAEYLKLLQQQQKEEEKELDVERAKQEKELQELRQAEEMRRIREEKEALLQAARKRKEEEQRRHEEEMEFRRRIESMRAADEAAAAQTKELHCVAKYKEAIGDATLTDDDVRMIMTELQGTGKPENKKAAIKHISRLATANEMSYDAAKDWLKAIIPV